MQTLSLTQGYAREAAARHPATLNSQPSTLNCCVQERLLREFARKGDAFHDAVMMALLRKEWPPAQRLDQRCGSIAAWRAVL